MTVASRRGYSALLTPGGVHVVAYERSTAGLRVTRYRSDLRKISEATAGETLASLLEVEGARGRRVSVGVSGFGTCHQILTLPPAPREILQPIIMRELRRFFPDLFAESQAEPIVDFVELTPVENEGPPQKELLVGAIPDPVLHGVLHALGSRGIELEHWTILPQALQRLVESFGRADETSAAVLMVPGWPLLGFFHEGEIRLFSEPRTGPPGSSGSDVESIVTHVERGSVFLRQQYQGASLTRLMVAAGPEIGLANATQTLEERLAIAATGLGPPDMAPGALAAFGAALDAAAPDGLNLLPEPLRPPSFTDLWTRRLVAATAGVLIAAAAWWGWSARSSELAASERLEATAARVVEREAEIAEVRQIIAARQGHTQRSILLQVLAHDARRLPEILWPLQDAAPQVNVSSLHLTRQPEGWSVSISAEAVAWSYPEASAAIAQLVQQLGAELPVDALTVSGVQLDRANPPDSTGLDFAAPAIAARTQMSFIVPAAKELAQ